MTSGAHDDDWAEARGLLDRVRPEPEDRREHRLRLHRRLSVLGMVLTGTAVVGLLLLAVSDHDSLPGDVEPAAWRIAVGFTVQVVGLVLMIAVLFTWSGAVRHTRGWARPLHRLPRGARMGLYRQARGKTPVVPDQLPFARHTARLTLVQRPPLTATSALLLLFVGQYVASPGTVRLVLTLSMAVVVSLGAVHARRDTERLERFLAEHPDPGQRGG